MLLALISKIKKIGSRLSRRGATLILCAAAPFYLVLFNIKLFVIFFDVVGARGLIHDITTAVLAPSVFYYTLTTLFILYAVFGLFLFFYWGSIGLRGLFYLAELIILFVLVGVAFGLFILLRYGIIYTFEIGELFISDSVGLQCAARFDMLSLVGSAVVLILTALALTFGVEYMSREAFAYNVIVILCTFSASIVWFILSINLGMMTIFWELSGIFSLMLVDTFYNRIRTTQAVSRTFVISRLSDYFIFIALGSFVNLFESDSISAAIAVMRSISAESTTLAALVGESTEMLIILFSVFVAASCKCAQFVLFVWLPDAMEAPTPASALIHSSTLVVMGIFMLLRFAPLYQNCSTVLYAALLCGAITIVYGATAATQTGDLKKAVAYSTISQVGYLYCGCGLLALKETLLYLIIHALCKAMLFVLVGYVVHLFGGTTSLRKMGGVFYIIPDVACSMTILCLILAGAPYTIGFIAKEAIVTRLLSASSPIIAFVIFCWVVSFMCTPLYLYRVCVLPIFGKPRCSRKVYRNLLLLKNKSKSFAFMSFNLNKLNNPLAFFIHHTRDTVISSRVTALLHAALLITILYTGEFLIYAIFGLFGASSTLFAAVPANCGTVYVAGLALSSGSIVVNLQILILVLFTAITLYFVLAKKRDSADYFIIAVFVIVAAVVTALGCGVYTMLL